MTLASLTATTGFLWLYFLLDEEPQYWLVFFPASVLFGLGMGILASQLNSAALRDIPAQSIATANGIHQSLRYAVGGMGVAIAITVLDGTHTIGRYDLMWLVLGLLMLLVAPLMWFLYPREQLPEQTST